MVNVETIHQIDTKCFQPCYCKTDASGNVLRWCHDRDIVLWENTVYSYVLQTKEVTPLITFCDNRITYHTARNVPLRTYLSQKATNEVYALNEVFAFVSQFSLLGFIHGNLHIDNIFVKPERLQLVVIDLANSYVPKEVPPPPYIRTSFTCEFESFESPYVWDLFTLYISLKSLYKNKTRMLKYIEQLMQSYVGAHTLRALMEEHYRRTFKSGQAQFFSCKT